MCKIPCWPSPAEAKKLIKLGYGHKLMVEEREHPADIKKEYIDRRFIPVLCPAKPGLEGKSDDYGDKKGCVFQEKGLCQLHTICKPVEGRLAICKGREPVDLRNRVALLWDNKKAKALIRKWIREFGKGDKIDWELLGDGSYVYLGDDDDDDDE